MRKEIILDKEQIQSKYFTDSQEKSFLVLSDIHFHPHVDKTLYQMVIQYVIKREPDYILMPGDIFETDDFLDDKESVQFFDTFIHCLKEVSKVIIIPGNHDITDYNVKTSMSKKYSGVSRSMQYLANLNSIPNVYFLDNEQLDINQLTFLGLNPRNETYQKKNDSRTNEMFIEDYIKGNYHVKEGNYNIILCHNPLPFFDSQVTDAIPDFDSCDLSVSGHFHNGYMSRKAISRLGGNTNIGLFTVPWISPIPGTPCRGLHPFGRGYTFISKGFRKWGADLLPFNILDKLAEHDMEELTISKPKVLTR